MIGRIQSLAKIDKVSHHLGSLLGDIDLYVTSISVKIAYVLRMFHSLEESKRNHIVVLMVNIKRIHKKNYAPPSLSSPR